MPFSAHGQHPDQRGPVVASDELSPFATSNNDYYQSNILSGAARNHLQTAAASQVKDHIASPFEAANKTGVPTGSEPGAVSGIDSAAASHQQRANKSFNLTHGNNLNQTKANTMSRLESATNSNHDKNSLYEPTARTQQNRPSRKTNVLTGAASTSYQYPVIWAGQYMGLVGYQVQRENEENEKRLKQLQELATSAAIKKQEKKKVAVSLPMRGRHMHIGDLKRDQAMRSEVFKQANETEELHLKARDNNFLEHVKRFEEEIILKHQADAM